MRIGMYPGTFDPVTYGHLDIIRRAIKLVDHLVVGVAMNEDKRPLFTLEERVAMLKVQTGFMVGPGRATIEVVPFNRLLVHFAAEVGARIIIRGLRAVSDFEYEFQMVAMNDKLSPDIETVFLMADPQHQAVASRLVKEIARLGGDVTHFVPPEVKMQLLEKYRK